MNYNKADFIASYGISSQLPESDRPELSFSGRSNVGKSSLINKLCNRKNLARVSSTPGKTATINVLYGWAASIWSICRVTATPRWRRANGSAGINSSTAISSADGDVRCWCSCWTAAMPPAPTMK